MLAVVTNAALLGAFESALLSSSGNVTALDALNLYLICQTQHPQQFCLTPRGQLIDRICHATFRKMQFVKSGSFHVSRDGTVVVITSGPPYVHTRHTVYRQQVVWGEAGEKRYEKGRARVRVCKRLQWSASAYVQGPTRNTKVCTAQPPGAQKRETAKRRNR